ncbi:MAG: PqqD family protein [Acidobacteria bacterium]|nr:PqqD family protein [Acidobacteriota bacterium]
MNRFEAAPATRLLSTEDGALIVDLQTDLYYSLNRTGLETWNVLSVGGTVKQAAGALARSFGVPIDRALALVEGFVDSALSASLLVARGDD